MKPAIADAARDIGIKEYAANTQDAVLSNRHPAIWQATDEEFEVFWNKAKAEALEEMTIFIENRFACSEYICRAIRQKAKELKP